MERKRSRKKPRVRLTITLWDEPEGSGIDILDIMIDLEKLKENIREFEREKKKWDNIRRKAIAKRRRGQGRG